MRSTRDEVVPERQGRRRQTRDTSRYRKRSGIAQREPPIACLGRSPGLRVEALSLRPHLPVLTAQWSVAVSVLAYRCVGSAGIAFLSRMLTGFPFHPRSVGLRPQDT